MSNGQIADTYDWDTAFGVYFEDANKVIAAKKSSPASFTGPYVDSFDDSTVTIAGNFGDWQLSGGSGSLAQMTLPVAGGTVTTADDVHAYSGQAVIEVQLTYVPQPPAGNSGQSNQLVVANSSNTTNGTSSTDPIVSVLSFTFDKDSVWQPDNGDVVVSAVLQKWLNANLGTFTHAFSVVDINSQADQGALQWLQPTQVSYAVVASDSGNGQSSGQSILGVLAMTEGRTNPNLSNQLSPNIIPTGANAGFVISQERFIEKMFLPGVYLLFQGATADDFDTNDDGSTITNIGSLAFQNFVLENGNTITDAKVPAGGFTLTAFDDHLELQFTGLTFTYQSGFIASIDYTGFAGMALDSNHNLQMDESTTPTVSLTVTKTTAESWKEFGIGIGVAIGLAVLGAAFEFASSAASDAADAAVNDAANNAAQEADNAADDNMAYRVSPSGDDPIEPGGDAKGNQDDEEDASADVKNAKTEGYCSKFKGFLRRNWKKVLGGVVINALGYGASQIPDLLAAYGQDDATNIPTLDKFAENAISSTVWPNTSGFTLTSASLNRSLQLGINLNYTSS
jgi:Clostridium P-47 protein